MQTSGPVPKAAFLLCTCVRLSPNLALMLVLPGDAHLGPPLHPHTQTPQGAGGTMRPLPGRGQCVLPAGAWWGQARGLVRKPVPHACLEIARLPTAGLGCPEGLWGPPAQDLERPKRRPLPGPRPCPALPDPASAPAPACPPVPRATWGLQGKGRGRGLQGAQLPADTLPRKERQMAARRVARQRAAAAALFPPRYLHCAGPRPPRPPALLCRNASPGSIRRQTLPRPFTRD